MKDLIALKSKLNRLNVYTVSVSQDTVCISTSIQSTSPLSARPRKRNRLLWGLYGHLEAV